MTANFPAWLSRAILLRQNPCWEDKMGASRGLKTVKVKVRNLSWRQHLSGMTKKQRTHKRKLTRVELVDKLELKGHLLSGIRHAGQLPILLLELLQSEGHQDGTDGIWLPVELVRHHNLLGKCWQELLHGSAMSKAKHWKHPRDGQLWLLCVALWQLRLRFLDKTDLVQLQWCQAVFQDLGSVLLD